MKLNATFERRTFLYGTAAAAGAVMLSACADDGDDTGNGNGNGGAGAPEGQGSAADPLPTPSELKEAPMLTEMVEAGDLPPLEERLPTNPYVIPHNWFQPGEYGGNLRLIIEATAGSPSNSKRNYSYGHSLLRYLNDALDIGPGLVEEWESNDDTSEWTLHFREGLKWSDGEPWTTADIMFWWEDIVLNDGHAEVAPDECRSGTGTLVDMSAPDDHTLVMSFDAPTPLTADRLAMWANGGEGSNGPIWMLPRHYVEQFHPDYNPDAPDNWGDAGGAMEQNGDYSRNPDCPTMTGWRVSEYTEGQQIVWERNPYFWVVGPDGAQLPYIDTLTHTAVQEAESGKLMAQDGEVDYLHGPHFSTTLDDVSTMMESRERADTDVLLWDSGSGTGSICFLNYDHRDEQLRELFRDPRFQRALSHAIDREEAQRAIYFERGELTTGTMSPKAIEYQVNEEGEQIYAEWRDSYVEYSPDLANELLDELGLEDTDGDGFRELPDGTPLELSLDFPADTSPDHQSANEQRRRDWGEVGINTTLSPVPPEGYGDQWENGELMIRTSWEVGDGPNHLVYPQWLVPIEPARWAPLTGRFYQLRGTPAESEQLDLDPFDRTPPRMEAEEGGPIEQLWELYDQSKVEPDEMERHRLVWQMIRVHIEHGPFFIGMVANTPQVIVIKNDLRNVPRAENLALGGFVNPWIHPTPAVYDPECYFWANPEEHSE